MTKASETRAVGPSIADVAREAGVATSTVSRALTMPGRIAEPTRLKVEAAARKLGYTGNQTARNLRVGRAHTIMIVLPEELYIGASQTVIEVLRAAGKALKERDFSLLIANISRETETDEHILNVARGGTVSGVLLMASEMPRAKGRSLVDTGLPIVSLHFDLSAQGIPSVVSDDHDAICAAVSELIALGHRRFLYVRGREGNYHDIERLRGVRTALANRNVQGNALQLYQGDFNFGGGVRAGMHYLEQSSADRPTAVVCANDDTAIGFIKTVVDGGLRVPDDVSVIGFDGAAVGAFMLPALSTIQQATSELGQRAADLVIDLVLGQTDIERRVEVPCAIVLRDSVRALTV